MIINSVNSPDVTQLHFVICTRGEASGAQTVRSLRRHGFSASEMTVIEHNSEGLPACYNKVINDRIGRPEILTLIHDDVGIWDVLIREKLLHAVNVLGFSIVGVAGAASFTTKPGSNGLVW